MCVCTQPHRVSPRLKREATVLPLLWLDLQAVLDLVGRHQPDGLVRERGYLELHSARPARVHVSVAVVPWLRGVPARMVCCLGAGWCQGWNLGVVVGAWLTVRQSEAVSMQHPTHVRGGAAHQPCLPVWFDAHCPPLPP